MPELIPEEVAAVEARVADEEAARVKTEEDEAAAEEAVRIKAEEDEEAAAATAAAAETELDEDGKPKKTFQGRIDELTWKFRESERQSEYWKKIAMGEVTQSNFSLKIHRVCFILLIVKLLCLLYNFGDRSLLCFEYLVQML